MAARMGLSAVVGRSLAGGYGRLLARENGWWLSDGQRLAIDRKRDEQGAKPAGWREECWWGDYQLTYWRSNYLDREDQAKRASNKQLGQTNETGGGFDDLMKARLDGRRKTRPEVTDTQRVWPAAGRVAVSLQNASGCQANPGTRDKGRRTRKRKKRRKDSQRLGQSPKAPNEKPDPVPTLHFHPLKGPLHACPSTRPSTAVQGNA